MLRTPAREITRYARRASQKHASHWLARSQTRGTTQPDADLETTLVFEEHGGKDGDALLSLTDIASALQPGIEPANVASVWAATVLHQFRGPLTEKITIWFFWSGALAMESKQPDTAQQEVLSGWKDIAHYLGRGVRTVQRYERELGLPVRRPSGHPVGAVLALKSELDSWVKLAPRAAASSDASQRPRQVYLSSELAKRLQERALLHAQMMTLRKEMNANIRTLRDSIAKVRQQLNETQKRQDSIESVIRRYSNELHILPVDQKRHKPN